MLDFILISSRRRRIQTSRLRGISGPREGTQHLWTSRTGRTVLLSTSYGQNAGQILSKAVFDPSSDGAALIVGFAFQHGTPITGPDSLTWSETSDRPTGTYAAVSITGDQALLATGALGSYPLFSIEDRDRVIVASNPRMAREAAAALGRRPVVDKEQLVWMPTLTNLGTEESLCAGMRLLPMSWRLAQVRKGRLTPVVTEDLAGALRSTFDPDELVVATADSMIRDLQSITSSSNWDVTADLTGGMDSRVLLSAISAAAALDRVRVATYGRDGERADAVVARQIAASLAFDLHEKDAVRSAAGAEPTSIERLRWFVSGVEKNVLINDGHVQAFTALTLRPPVPRQLSLWGLFGENMRSFYGKAVDKLPANARSPAAIAERLLVNLDLLTPTYRDYAIGSLSDFIRYRMDNGLSPAGAADALFVERRSRWFHGLSVTGQWYTTASYGPLLSTTGLRLAFAIGDQDRIRNAAPFRLIRHMEPRLLDLPFANYQWHPSIHSGVPPVTDVDRPLQYQYRWFDVFLPEISRAARDAAGTFIWDVFDPNVARKWLDQPQRDPREAMGLINLYGLIRAVEAW